MALYSCSISNIKRSDGRSSVAKAAYNSRTELLDERTGNNYNYSHKQDLGFSEVITPINAPPWAEDRQQLWSKNELANKRRDARVAKEILVALPRELDTSQQQKLVRSFVSNNLTPLGVVADVNAHELDQSDRDDWNPHVHILISTQHLVDDEFGSKITELNKKDFVTKIRVAWAEHTNIALSAAGSVERVDHRSNKERGIDRTPQIHLGHRVWAMKQKGIATERGDRYIEIEERNQEIDTITADVGEAIDIAREVKQQEIIKPAEAIDYHQPYDWTELVNQLLDSPPPKPEQPKTKQPSDNSQSKPSSWWQKAANFVLGKKPQPEPSTTQSQTQSNKQQNYDSPPVLNSPPPYLEPNTTREEKQEVARALVKQLQHYRQINARLKIVPGKLVVLIGNNQATVLAIESGKSKDQQEKMIVKQSETGWSIIKYQLRREQRQRLLKVLKEVEQQPVSPHLGIDHNRKQLQTELNRSKRRGMSR